MPFNIKTEKILSPSNIKKIIMLGISLRDQLENTEKGLISDYDNTKTYTRGQAVYYNNYLYKCLYTTTGDFDESKWQLIGDDLDLVTKADIEAMLGLTQEEIASLQSLISTEIRLDKCFSSSDTYNRILNAENECKKFTLEQLAKKAGVVYKIVADTTGVDSTEFLYLISNGSNGYNIYAYIDGSAVKISDTNINLDDYAKLSDLDDFVKKTDADGKYATITTVDGKVDKTSILSTASSTATNEQVYSASIMNTELANKLGKTDMSTTIDSTSTDDTVPTNKSVYDNAIANKRLKTYAIAAGADFPDLKTLQDIANNLPSNSIVLIDSAHDSTSFFGLPSNKFTIVWMRRYAGRDSIMAYTPTGLSYICTNISKQTWKRVCTTSVDDVSKTSISWSDETYFKSNDVISTGNYYQVRNGVCFVNIDIICTTPKDGGYILPIVLPKPTTDYVHANISSLPNGAYEHSSITIAVAFSGTHVAIYGGIANNRYLGTFSYPVSES